MTWVAGGLAGGLGLGLAADSTIRSLSNTAIPEPPFVYAAVALFFVTVTLLAAYLPLRRAARLDPIEALRRE